MAICDMETGRNGRHGAVADQQIRHEHKATNSSLILTLDFEGST
jgi:hypothetical protein